MNNSSQKNSLKVMNVSRISSIKFKNSSLSIAVFKSPAEWM